MLTVSSGYRSANVVSPTNTVIKSNGKISVYDVDNATTKVFDNTSVGLIEVTANSYIAQRIIGNVVAHLLKVEMYGDTRVDFALNTEKHITPSFGMLVSGSYEWVDYQKFIVTEVDYDDTTRMTMIKGVDFTLKTNGEFIDTNTYPMTLFDYATSVANACGMSIENLSLINGSFSITSKPFVDYTSCRVILGKIAELGGYFIHINKSSGKLEFKNAFNNGSSVQTFTLDNYFDLALKEHNFGSNGINTLVIKISQVEGENNTVNNSTNVAIDGAIEVQVVDNDIVNSEAKRLLVIDDLFDVIDGFKFIPFDLNYIGYSWLELGDRITVTQKDSSTFTTMITDLVIRYNGGLFGNLKAQALSKVQTTYQNLPSSIKRLRNTELMVDKVNSDITALADTFTIQISERVPITTHNYILNSNFASDFDNWTNNGSGTGTRTIETISDKKYFRLETTTTTNSFYGILQLVRPYQHGAEITYSITCRRNSGDGRLRFRVESTGDGNQNPIIDNYITPTSEFVRYSFTFTSSSVAEKDTYRLFLVMESNKVAQIDMSDVQLEVGSAATSYILNPAEIPNTKYVFSREGASFFADAFKLYSSVNQLKVFFDLVKDALNLGININVPIYNPANITELVQIMSGGTKGFQFGEPDGSNWYKAYITAVNMRTIAGLSEDEIRLRIRSSEVLELFGDDGLSLNSDGYISVNRGIKFPSDKVPSTNLNTLDDYEEGTWTPVLVGATSAGTGTYTSQVGTFTKIGNTVHFDIYLVWTAHTGTGQMKISLPFTARTGVEFVCRVLPSNLTYSNQLAGVIPSGEDEVFLFSHATGGARAVVNMDTSATLSISGTYRV